ncbi:MAG: nucleoside phosphorylase [Thermoplasmata archaeon]
MKKEKSVTMLDSEGHQYHIGLKKGELADRVMLAGDPDRVDVGKKLFDNIEFESQRREFRCITGKVHGVRMSMLSTGIGPDNTEIAVIEACQIVKNPVFIRVGSCGCLQEQVRPGDQVISTGSIAYENTSTFFVPECFPAIASIDVVLELERACNELGLRHHVGLTATTPGFYGSQGRSVGKFHPLPFKIEELENWGVLNFEMESSCLFRLAMIGGARAGTICAAYNNRITDEMISTKQKKPAQEGTIKAAMLALSRL